MAKVPYAKGDLLVALTDIDPNNADIRRARGPGRIIHFDNDFNVKNTLLTNQIGLVVGLALSPSSQNLYAADPITQTVTCFDKYGQRIGSLKGIPRRPYGTLAFDWKGRLILGVHSNRQGDPDDEYGGSKIILFDERTNEVVGYTPRIDGGRTGWHCVTNLTQDVMKEKIYYVSEGGHDIACFDLRAERQLQSFHKFDENSEAHTYGLALMKNGIMLMGTGAGACQLSPEGKILKSYNVDIPSGWTRISLPKPDSHYFYLNNFLEGVVQRRHIETGDVMAEYKSGLKFALCGLLEVSE